MLSKQQPQCQLLPPPSSISPSQMFLHSHHPKGTGAGPGSPGECDEDGWRVVGVVLGFPSLGLCSLLSWKLSALPVMD